MKLAPSRIRERVIAAQLLDWPRILPTRRRATPAGAGFGSNRFSCPTDTFRVLYAADNFPTARNQRWDLLDTLRVPPAALIAALPP